MTSAGLSDLLLAAKDSLCLSLTTYRNFLVGKRGGHRRGINLTQAGLGTLATRVSGNASLEWVHSVWHLCLQFGCITRGVYTFFSRSCTFHSVMRALVLCTFDSVRTSKKDDICTFHSVMRALVLCTFDPVRESHDPARFIQSCGHLCFARLIQSAHRNGSISVPALQIQERKFRFRICDLVDEVLSRCGEIGVNTPLGRQYNE